MSNNIDLNKIRDQIDSIDDQLIELFEKRMNLASDVAKYKMENNMQILNSKREREIINRISKNIAPQYSVYSKILYKTLFDLSRSYQSKLMHTPSDTSEKIKKALDSTKKVLPSSAVVACQGTEGSNSQRACEKVFYNPSIMYFDNFKGVFEAVNSGMCKYGILPLENSVHGSVSAVIDLMREYDFNIVKSTKIQITHTLLAKPGTKEIKEIFSHEQALGQCDKFLSSLKNVKITPCANTAIAAKMVAESERDDVAAIASPLCSELYGLKIVNDSINNNDNNYTRFICISKGTEIYPGADTMSFLINLSHKPGALYNMISKLAAEGINLTKIESRPISGKDFEFMFYVEISVSVYSEDLPSVIADFEHNSDSFKFLGCYSEN